MATNKEKQIQSKKRKEHIKKLRNQLNQKDPNEIYPFTKYKMITYFWIFVFSPYALYRIWGKNTEFNRTEKAAQTFFICCYIGALFNLL